MIGPCSSIHFCCFEDSALVRKMCGENLHGVAYSGADAFFQIWNAYMMLQDCTLLIDPLLLFQSFNFVELRRDYPYTRPLIAKTVTGHKSIAWWKENLNDGHHPTLTSWADLAPGKTRI
ncbi:hypothetical protein AVEN_84264-1 [Araneus ventricosus]|uniref:Uncharacterized protein n=1 Tax=Araneus ventricosus TaxID=182803 RepID=A0A4Y2J1U9_ARAVE|nr:hypothetical protein AVEN_84264-1 [Araneus ventricosus]